MGSFDAFFLLNTDTARAYAVEVLRAFSPGEPLLCREIGDGNINYVFRVSSEKSGRSLIIKQADRLLRASGRPLGTGRSMIEAEVLALEGRLAPGFVPEVYHYDAVMAATAMEDVGEYKNLREELMANRVYPHLAENISSFLALTLLPTTDLVLPSDEKKRNVKRFINPELCDITEDLVLSEPYMSVPYRERNRNIITPGNEGFVTDRLYNDPELQYRAALLREAFMNRAEALLHGDLHTGSVFACPAGIKVLDPEFAFYGPMGYDIGCVVGNLFFAWANRAFTAPGEPSAEAIARTVRDVFDLTNRKLAEKYDELVSLPMYTNPLFKNAYLARVTAESAGYAGAELIRRTVGDSKVPELVRVTDLSVRVPMERALIELGTELVKNGSEYRRGSALTERFEEILKRYL